MRINITVSWTCSTLMFKSNLSYIASTLFMHKHFTYICTYKLHDSGPTCHFLFLKPPQAVSHCFLTYQLTGWTWGWNTGVVNLRRGLLSGKLKIKHNSWGCIANYQIHLKLTAWISFWWRLAWLVEKMLVTQLCIIFELLWRFFFNIKFLFKICSFKWQDVI